MSRLVWFRDDLRLHDNEMLTAALKQEPSPVSFLFVWDERLGSSRSGQVRPMGDGRKAFLLESLRQLQIDLEKIGADLICVRGETSQTVLEMCRRLEVRDLFYSSAFAFNERVAEFEILRSLEETGCRAHSFQTQTLANELDFPVDDFSTPISFSKFRSRIERGWRVREPVPAVSTPINQAQRSRLTEPLDGLDVVRLTEDRPAQELKRGFQFAGGERNALHHLRDWIWNRDGLKSYRQTRNGLLRFGDSSKFAPYLALGSLSPRIIYQAVRDYEAERGSNSSTLWFLYELLWRDHFRFQARSRGARLFLDRSPATRRQDEEAERAFRSWCEARTKNALVNAAMVELDETGWLSNRMRQIVASFLIFDLGVDWRWGAEWFQSQLIDYDPCSNWGNWSYIAGAGPMNKPHPFDVKQQEAMYDPDRAYQTRWSRQPLETL